MKLLLKRTTAFLICAVMLSASMNLMAVAAPYIELLPEQLVAGDVNGDGAVNNKDLTRLLRLIAGEDISVVAETVDVNGDGTVNNKDLTRLLRFLAGDDVEVHIKKQVCTHNIKKQKKVDATCTEAGNIEYWTCTLCGLIFADSAGITTIDKADTIIEAKGHKPVIIPAVAATYDSTGLTEGSRCEVCKEILVEQKVVEKLKKNTYSITYHLTSGADSYLAAQTITNPNKSIQDSDKAFTLSNNLIVPGYVFDGWYDSFSENATKITTIPKGTTGNVEVYGHWTINKYSIQFQSDESNPIQLADEYYTVAQRKVLPSPTLPGYSFVGWSDDEGKIIKQIPRGTIGDKVYYANWLSNRNQARTKKSIGEPIITEEDNKILFVYEIGEIRNVPVSVIKDFGFVLGGGVSSETSVTHSKTVSKEQIESYAKTVANATTENYGIVLSSGWSDGMTVDKAWCKEHNVSEEDAKSLATNDSDNWYVSNGNSGSSTTVTYNSTQETNMDTSTHNSSKTGGSSTAVKDSHSEEKHKDISVTESATFSVEGKAKTPVTEVSMGLDATLASTQSWGDSNTQSHAFEQTFNHSGTSSDGDAHQGGTVTHTGSDTTSSGSWNSESGRSGSKSVTSTNSTSKTISDLISEKTGYGKSYIETGSESKTQGFSSQQSTSESYSTGITYSTSETETITESINTTNTIEGYHRWVWATTSHVFMVVGYDIATSSYFVCNYSVLDDQVQRFEDYSYDTSAYDDNQTGVISFEIPTDIKDYVADRIAGSDGLQFSKDGKVTGYTGTDDYVIIPDYKVINGTVIKVTGITENAFKGKVELSDKKNKLIAVQLSDFMTEIPANAFAGCTALQYIDCRNVTKIGNNAFAGCTGLDVTRISEKIYSLGKNAFEGLNGIIACASNKSVVEAVINSGAKVIALVISDKCSDLENVTLTVPKGTEFFGFYGRSNGVRVFKNVSLVSEADVTVVSNAIFESTKGTPLKINSADVVLSEVQVSAPGISAMFTSPATNLSLYGESTLKSSKGDAVLTKDLSLFNSEKELYAQLNLNGNLLVNGNVEQNGLISFASGKIVPIADSDFNRYLKGTYVITFNPDGGSVSEKERTAYYGAETGSFPTPTRDYYQFEGWYMEDGKTRATPQALLNNSNDITLTAHWKIHDPVGWVKASDVPAGAQILERKFSYTLRERKTSGSSFESGWTKYDEKITSYGSEQGPVYSNPANGVRKVREEPYITGYTPQYTQYFYSRYVNSAGYNGKSYKNGARCYGYSAGNMTYYQETGWLDSPLYDSGPSETSSNGRHYGYESYNGYDSQGLWWFNQQTRTLGGDPIYGTRWYYQDPIYTYYHYRDVSKEDSVNPSGKPDVSHVQEWVKYRAK